MVRTPMARLPRLIRTRFESLEFFSPIAQVNIRQILGFFFICMVYVLNRIASYIGSFIYANVETT